MTKLKYYSGSAWVEVPDGDAIKIYRPGGLRWVTPAKLSYRSATGWEPVWSRSTTPVVPPTPTLTSDPMTFTHSPTDSGSWRPNGGWRNTLLIYQASFGFGDHAGCIAFDYPAIKAQLDVRPKVTSARLKIMREDTAHGDTGVHLLLWSLTPGEVNSTNKLTKSGRPDLVNGSKEIGTVQYGRGSYLWEPISTVFIDRFRLETARGLAFAEDETYSRTGGVDTNYAKFEGWSAVNKPILEFTCDY